MQSFIHDINNLEKILDLTSETLIVFSKEGICLDVDSHSDLWFMNRQTLQGKNIISLLPNYTYNKAIIDFQSVLTEKKTLIRKYRLPIKGELYYAECKLTPFGEYVLCRFSDITHRENVDLKLKQAHDELLEIQKIAKIGKWRLDSRTMNISYRGAIFDQSSLDWSTINYQDFLNQIVNEDQKRFDIWAKHVLLHVDNNDASFRVWHNGQVYYMSVKCIMRYETIDRDVSLEGIIQNTDEIQKSRNDINILTHVVYNVSESIYGAMADGTMYFANSVFRKNHHIPIDADIKKRMVFDFHLGFAPDKESWIKRVAEMENCSMIPFVDMNHPVDNELIVGYEGIMYKITNDDGTFSYWSFAHDISDRIRYESEIKRSNQLINLIVNNLPVAVSVKDVKNDFKFMYCNDYATSIYQQGGTDSLIGKNDFDVFPYEQAKAQHDEDEELVRNGGGMIRRIVNMSQDKGGMRYYDKRKLYVSDPHFSPMIVVIDLDITQQELLKHNLIDAKKKAEESDKLKTTFLTNMSHEIRTPLNAIMGFSDVLVNCETQSERASYNQIIKQSTKRLIKLINDLMLLSRIESGDVTVHNHAFNISEVCSNVFDLCSEMSSDTISLFLDDCDKSLVMVADDSRLLQILNMLITTLFKIGNTSNVHFGYNADQADYITFYVQGDGLGIGKNDEDVFGLFTQYNYGNNGLGLELTLCHALVKLMGGSITAQSVDLRGNKFTFWIPQKANE